MTSLRLHDYEFTVHLFENDFIILRSSRIDGTINAEISLGILNQRPKFVDEVISSPSEILLKINEHFHEKSLESLYLIDFKSTSRSRQLKLPVFFGHEFEWDRVDLLTGLSKEVYIEKLVEADLTVSMFGFIPGFIYIDGLPEALYVPRKENPARHQSPNTIAVGGPYLGIYSIPSPGGWTSLGQAAVTLFDPGTLPPTQLNPGDKLQLEILEEEEFINLSNQSITLLKYNGIH
ncbi:MAG: carboxyltransferase domain-containing protein [Saprospiraceae bacterium]|nr:allophanate hydrolase subunit 1 [Bacteroidia bacterium]NNF22997.1 carboxyltransferase domain-containing protein [Saprospiraceae bacterium]NNK89187.1 carboxyltransferase domain-containing protein [Saprospiraceae bacterium]